MPRDYEVTLWEKVTHTVIIEADSEEEAGEIAHDIVCEGAGESCSQGYYATIVNEVAE